MNNIIDIKKCVGCSACKMSCPQRAIKFEKNKEQFYVPLVNMESCIECNVCVQVCPVINKKQKKEKRIEPEAWAAISKSDLRLNSASGGVFPMLAQYVIQKNGIVYGAAWDGLKVRHIGIEKENQIPLLQSAKYLPSDIGDTYKEIEQYLKSGRTVLFSGIPCQVEGLKKYLRKEYDMLFCIDLICHGIPSERFFENYVNWRVNREQKNSSLVSVNFRKKIPGWSHYKYSVEFSYKNGMKTYISAGEDLFMQGFTNDICLRESCYECDFKGKNRSADITMGDFWGIWNLYPAFDDNKGTSLVVINTEKGKCIWSAVTEKLKIKRIDLDDALLYNSSYYKSAVRPRIRDKFIEKLESEDFERYVKNAVQQLEKQSNVDTIVRCIFQKIKKLL